MYAKSDSPGVFYMRKAGLVTAIKLVYISGEVGCSFHARSKWGCSNPNNIETVITDDRNNVVFPEDRIYPYEIDGFGSNSPELMLSFSNPLSVAAGQEFRVWYSEDLHTGDADNYAGPTCMKVIPYFG